MNPAGVEDWMWERQSRETQIRWVALGHTQSPSPPMGPADPGELARVTPERWAWAAQQVDAYNAHVPEPPPSPPPVVDVPPPPYGLPCPQCGTRLGLQRLA